MNLLQEPTIFFEFNCKISIACGRPWSNWINNQPASLKAFRFYVLIFFLCMAFLPATLSNIHIFDFTTTRKLPDVQRLVPSRNSSHSSHIQVLSICNAELLIIQDWELKNPPKSWWAMSHSRGSFHHFERSHWIGLSVAFTPCPVWMKQIPGERFRDSLAGNMRHTMCQDMHVQLQSQFQVPYDFEWNLCQVC